MAISGSEVRGESRAAQTFGRVERVLLAAGIVLFVVLLWQLGVDTVGENLLLIGWGFVPILGQEIGAIVANTLGWRWAFPADRRNIAFWLLAEARLAGDAINNVTPTATMGGELIRARMLGGAVDSSSLWASVVIAKITQAAGQIVFIFAGFLLVIESTHLPPGIARALLIGLGLIGTGIAVAVVLQRRGMFVFGAELARRVGLPVPAHLDERLKKLDDEVARFHRDPRAFLASTAWFLVGWLFGVVEVWLILHFLGIGADWRRALTIEILSTSIDAILFFVPAKVGTQEGGKALIFSILQLDPAKGFALGIARRIRELFWSMVGLLLLSRQQARARSARP